MSSGYLDPKVDLPFKRVFGEHANLLKSFLNALLPLPEDALDIEWRNDPDIMKALSLVEVGAFTPMELERYHMYQDRARIEPTMLADAKAEGLIEGEAKGARKTAFAIAKSLLPIMPNDADIAAVTGLTVSEVAALRVNQD